MYQSQIERQLRRVFMFSRMHVSTRTHTHTYKHSLSLTHSLARTRTHSTHAQYHQDERARRRHGWHADDAEVIEKVKFDGPVAANVEEAEFENLSSWTLFIL